MESLFGQLDQDEEERQRQLTERYGPVPTAPPQIDPMAVQPIEPQPAQLAPLPYQPPPPPSPAEVQQSLAQTAGNVTNMLGNLPGQLGSIDQYNQQQAQFQQAMSRAGGGGVERAVGSVSNFLGNIPALPGIGLLSQEYNAVAPRIGLPESPVPNPTIGDIFGAQNRAMEKYGEGLQQVPGYTSLPAPVQAGVQALPFALLPGGPESAAARLGTAFLSGVGGYGAQQGAAVLGAGPATQQAAGLLGGIGAYEGVGALSRIDPMAGLNPPRTPTAIGLDRPGSGSPASIEEAIRWGGGGSAIPPGPRDPYNLFDAAGRERAAAGAQTPADVYREQIARTVPPDLQPVYTAALEDVLAGRRAQAPTPQGTLGPDPAAEPYRIAHDAIRQQLAPDMPYLNAPLGRAAEAPPAPPQNPNYQPPSGQPTMQPTQFPNYGQSPPSGTPPGGAGGAGTPPGAGGAPPTGGVPPTGAGAPPPSGVPPAAAPPPPPPGASTDLMRFIQQWQEHTERRFNVPLGTMKTLQDQLGRWFAGHPSDSYLAAIVERRPVLEARLDREPGMTPKDKAAILNDQVRYQATQHYNGDMAKVQKLESDLAAFDKQRSSVNQQMQGVDTLKQRYVNTQFGMADVGAVGVNTLSAIRNQGLPIIAGLGDRLAQAFHIPGSIKLGDRSGGISEVDAARNAGLHLGSQESIRRAGEGTLLSYFPGLAAVDKHILTPILDKITNAQYDGLVAWGKLQNYKGQLQLLRLSGADISEPRVQAAAAKVVNDAWSSGRLASNPIRAAVERDITLSAGMTRGQIGTVFDAAQILAPGATFAERVLAASIISSNLAFVYGLGKFLNDKVGIGEWQPNPGFPGFGTITLPTTDSNGRHHVVSLISQGTFAKALAQTVTALHEGNPEDIKAIWEKYGFSRINPILGVGARVGLGAGYDTKGHFYTGIGDDKMPRDEALKASIPVPQVAGQAINQGQTDPLSLGLSEFGANEYPESMGAQRARLGAEVLDNPQRLGQAYPDNPVMPQLLQGKDWNELMSPEKAALQKVMPPDEVKSIHDESYRQNPASTAHSDYLSVLREEKTARENVLLDLYNRGEMSKERVAGEMKNILREYYAKKDAADADPAYKAEQEKFKATANPNQAQALLDGYYRIADQFEGNKAGRDAAQKAYLDGIQQKDPVLYMRLLTAIQPQNQSRLEAMYYNGELR